MRKTGRASIFAGAFAIVAGLVVFTAMSFVGSEPPTINYTVGHQAGQPVNLTVETVGTIGFGAHPTWVSYLAMDPQSHQWVKSTIWQLPAHTTINVTLYQFDSGSPLRNQEMGLVSGVKGNAYTLGNGRSVSLVNSYAENVGHTFSVPSLGINVPLLAVQGTPKNFCNSGPCQPATQAHQTIHFSFTTPGPGSYRFQCFIPCGLGYLFGNGGPMSTLGYMGGFLEVQ